MKKHLHILPLALLLPLAAACWLPLLFLVGGSLMGEVELTAKLGPVLSGTPGQARWNLLPQFPTLRPYVELLLDSPRFFVMFWNSVKLTVGILLGQFLCGAMAAWGFARARFRGKNLLFTLYILLMLMPFQVTMMPNYLVLDHFSLLDSHWGILLPAAFSTFPVFIMYRFFKAVPESLIEAAELDGANGLQIFWRIGLPLGAGGVISAMVLGFLECWSLIEPPMTFLKDQSLWPLSLYLSEIAAGRSGLALAASVVTLIPTLLVFIYGQGHLERGIAAIGVKE